MSVKKELSEGFNSKKKDKSNEIIFKFKDLDREKLKLRKIYSKELLEFHNTIKFYRFVANYCSVFDIEDESDPQKLKKMLYEYITIFVDKYHLIVSKRKIPIQFDEEIIPSLIWSLCVLYPPQKLAEIIPKIFTIYE